MKILAHATYVGNSGYNSHCQNFFRALSKNNDLRIRNFTVGKNWNYFNETNQHGADVSELDKSLIKKQSLWSNGVLQDYDIYGGLGDFKHDINIVLAEVNHHYFYDEYSGPKIAYTVWESTVYPENFFERLKDYDQVWVPSEWQAEITINQGIEKSKVKIVPEGVDGKVFRPNEVIQVTNKFRFLIFGRWDDRKSIKELVKAFKNVFGDSKDVELILSADNPYSVDGMKSTEERLKFYDLEMDNVKILHFPSKEEYVEYLKTGHVFLSCARSEGWNLPLIEAMACGTPSIYSDCSGQLEFAKGKGIPVKIKSERKVSELTNSFCKEDNANWYEPDFNDLEEKMLDVYKNYIFYKEKALKDSIEIRNKFTWENAAQKANDILKEFMEKESYVINFLGTTDDSLGINYNSNTSEDVEVNVKIIDEFSGFVFHDENLIVNNKCIFFTKHAYLLPNQIFIISDLATKEIKLKIKINQNINQNWILPENEGLSFFIPEVLRNNKSLGFSYFEIYKRNTYNFKKCKIEKGDVVFDLGSCFGLFSRYAFQNGASEVHAFEPNKDLEEVYKKLNSGFKYFYSPKAVHSKPVDFKKSADFVGSKVIEGGEKDSNINLNNYIKEKNITKINFLKVDIEGSEYDLFETLDSDFLSNCVNKIAIEYHDNINNKIKIILDKLKHLGFELEFEFQNGENNQVGMLYAWKNVSFNFESFFSKYKDGVIKTGKSRAKFYEYIIPKLVARNKPLFILETGTMWEPFERNAGAFTLIMADLIKNFTGGKIYTIDISPESINKSKKNTEGFHDVIEFVQSDSVSYIKNLSDEFVYGLDLVYLDSYDFSFPNPHPSAQHHLEELNAVYDRLNDDCGIGIDDNFLPNTWVEWNYFNSDGVVYKKEKFEVKDKPRGKAEYCHPKLLSKGWKRIEQLDDYPNSNIFYYERSKFSVEDVNKILFDFYNKNSQKKPTTNKFIKFTSLTNQASGLGDAIILNNLSQSKHIASNFDGFNILQKYNDRYKPSCGEPFFDINSSKYNDFDWGGGHCTQRLELAFLGRKNKIPKPYMFKKCSVVKNRILVHFDGKTNILDKNIKIKTLDFLKNNGYTICYWDGKNLEASIEIASTCEYFIGVNSGPMHVAAALGLKSVIILNNKDSGKIYLPKIAEADIPESEWLYPQNIHLSLAEDNQLIEKFTTANLRRALEGKLYPYFTYDFILNTPNESDSEIHVINESGSLGDTLAWTPIVNEFGKRKNKKIKLYTPYKELFSSQYSFIEFKDYRNKPDKSIKPHFSLGCFDEINHKSMSLQEIACKILGMENIEIAPNLSIQNNKERPFDKKYICIATQSTAQCKYWNNPDGWQKTVNYLKDLGYEIICLDKYKIFGASDYYNKMPDGCVDKTGDWPLLDRINDILHCEFFIGLSSGLSWLAWACKKPVIMISGFTDPKLEFYTKYRVHNKNVCNSCWSDLNFNFDKSNWLWCPRNKNFECSKEITFEMVKEKIDSCINDLNY